MLALPLMLGLAPLLPLPVAPLLPLLLRRPLAVAEALRELEALLLEQ